MAEATTKATTSTAASVRLAWPAAAAGGSLGMQRIEQSPWRASASMPFPADNDKKRKNGRVADFRRGAGGEGGVKQKSLFASVFFSVSFF